MTINVFNYFNVGGFKLCTEIITLHRMWQEMICTLNHFVLA